MSEKQNYSSKKLLLNDLEKLKLSISDYIETVQNITEETIVEKNKDLRTAIAQSCRLNIGGFFN